MTSAALSPRGTRDLVCVFLPSTTAIRYGFYTSMAAAEKTQLGQLPAQVSGSYIPGLVLGANAPTPARATKLVASRGNQTSFMSSSVAITAIAAGWKIIKRASFRRGAKTRLTRAVYVAIGTGASIVKYAWNMPDWQYNSITPGDRAAMGITDCDPDDKLLVWGARHPRPAQARSFPTPISPGAATSVNTTFVATNRMSSLPSGWTLAGRGIF